LEALYGRGNYTVSFNTPHDGPRSLTCALQSVTNAPPPPRVANLQALQTVDAGQPLTVSWDAWSGGGPQDFVQLRVEDWQGNKVYETPDIGGQKPLNPGATNADIAGGTLTPGQTYEGTLSFKRIAGLNTTNYPAVLSLADYYSKTEFNIYAVPADLVAYSVCKGLVFTQAGSGPPVPLPTNGYVFSAQAKASSPTSVLNGAAITPQGNPKALMAQTGGLVWSFAERLATQSGLDTSYPFGTYTMQVNCARDGLKILSLTLSAATYPNAPHITAYNAAQVIDPTADYTLAWDPFAGPGGINGFIQLTISDLNGTTVFQTPDLGMPGALSGLATAAVIPAGTLSTNQSYQAALLFEGLEDMETTSYPGATGIAAVSATTQFRLGTRGPGLAPVLSLTFITSNHLFQVGASGLAAQQSYRLDGSASLPPQWTPLLTNTATGNTLFFLDPNSAGRRQFFYRLVVLP
jgi:hypothetical protein